METTRAPIVPQWLTDMGVAKRMGITVPQVHALISDGTFTGELRRLSLPGGTNPGFSRREFIFWVPLREVEAEMARRSALAVDATESDDIEWDAHGYKLAPPEPCVLYNLLTESDRAVLQERRARAGVPPIPGWDEGQYTELYEHSRKVWTANTAVITLAEIHRELAAVG